MSKNPGTGGGGATILSLVNHLTGERTVIALAAGGAGLFYADTSEDAGGQGRNPEGPEDRNPGISALESYLAVTGK